MPEAAIAPAPPAPSPTPTPAPAPAPAPSPAPPSGATPAIAQPVTPQEPPKKGSARERMHEELAKRAKPANGAVDPNAPQRTSENPTNDGKSAQPDLRAASAVADPKAPDKTKESPWKLVDRYKGRVTELESEIAKLRTTPISADDRKTFEERATKAEARAKELEEHMRFVDYSKTDEFKTKYLQPYNKAWENAISELKEITVTDGAGNQRPVQPQDILTLVNMPLGEARELADKAFGKFADDVMAHRKQIKGLWEAHNQALDDAKKNGGESLKQQQEAANKNFQAMQSSIKQTWEAENKALIEDKTYGPMFTKREGDEEWNTRLQRGFELVDRAFSENPADPKLTPEQRTAVVRRHAAIRNRAAAWGAVKAENDTLRSQIDELKKELEQYKGSEPGTAGGRINGNGNGAGKRLSAREQMHEDLRRRAKPFTG